MQEGKSMVPGANPNHWWGDWLGMCVAALIVVSIMAGCQSLPQPSPQAGARVLVIFLLIEENVPTDEQRTRMRLRSDVTWVHVTVVPMVLKRDGTGIDDTDQAVCVRGLSAGNDARLLVAIPADGGHGPCA